MEAKQEAVKITVQNLDETLSKANLLVEEIKTAKTLVNEMAVLLEQLEINIKTNSICSDSKRIYRKEQPMPSEWKVTSQYIGGEKQYAVYRTLDTSKPDHSGNREYASSYSANKQAAIDEAARLNEMEGA